MSDEVDCEKIHPESGYMPLTPPPTPRGEKLNIDLRVNLFDIQDIDEFASTFVSPFFLYLSWFDKRLTYKHLYNETILNTLSPRQIETIWTPVVEFENTNTKSRTVNPARDQPEDLSAVQVERRGEFRWRKGKGRDKSTCKDHFEAELCDGRENVLLFTGDENSLLMSRYYRMKFNC